VLLDWHAEHVVNDRLGPLLLGSEARHQPSFTPRRRRRAPSRLEPDLHGVAVVVDPAYAGHDRYHRFSWSATGGGAVVGFSLLVTVFMRAGSACTSGNAATGRGLVGLTGTCCGAGDGVGLRTASSGISGVLLGRRGTRWTVATRFARRDQAVHQIMVRLDQRELGHGSRLWSRQEYLGFRRFRWR
jgi:hypothetical protein